MDRNELLAKCRYYKSEEHAPSSLPHGAGILWEIEREWFRLVSGDSPSDRLILSIDRLRHSFPDMPEMLDDTPIPATLKGMIWERWAIKNDCDFDGEYLDYDLSEIQGIRNGFIHLLNRFYS